MATLFPDSLGGDLRSPLDLTMLLLLEERLHDFSRQLSDRIKEQRGQLATELLPSVAGNKLAHFGAEAILARVDSDIAVAEDRRDNDWANDALSSLSRAQHELQAVQEALKRIREGLYGWCKQCGEPIARDRLLALPYVCLCDVCQGKTRRSHGVLSPVH
ncbi:TraR/DksA family transcriptional regulator [Aquabacterium sp.]|uniref:TraR/DksA family transcriptional regulator n=1 Tax=Aquabacterium sp. TaxID=1872578 RepID=UPI0035AE7677